MKLHENLLVFPDLARQTVGGAIAFGYVLCRGNVTRSPWGEWTPPDHAGSFRGLTSEEAQSDVDQAVRYRYRIDDAGDGGVWESAPPSGDVAEFRGPAVYDYPMFLPGLGEDVVIHKTPRHTVYILRDGSRLSALEAQHRERVALHSKYGAAGVGFYEFAKATAPSAAIEALVMFDHDIDWESLQPSIAGREGPEARSASLLQVQKQIETLRAALTPKLRDLGLLTTHAPATMPAVFVNGSPAALLAAAHLEGVTLVQGAMPMRPELHAAKNGVTDSGIDTSFNAGNHWGAGQKIGMYEAFEQGVYDNHEAFALATPDTFTATHPANGVTYHGITYQSEPKNCAINADCGSGNYCMDLGHSGHAKQCVMGHGTQVLSVSSGAVGVVAYGAARATYFVANQGDGLGKFPLQCDAKNEALSYDWFVQNQVTTVVESYGCFGAPGVSGAFANGASAEGTVQDWYARNYGIFIAKAAGNNTPGAQQPACPYTNNSLCVGATIASAARMSCSSSFNNNNVWPNGTRSDREEPDVVAFGSEYGACADPAAALQLEVADPSKTTSDWTLSAGTSFAAPQLAALAALCKEVFPGHVVDERLLRSIMQVSGFSGTSRASTTPLRRRISRSRIGKMERAAFWPV